MDRVECPECGRDVAGYVPRRGDGSMLRVHWHKNDGEPCAGRFELVEP